MVQHLIWEILGFKSLNNENYYGVDCLKMKEFIFSYNDNEITIQQVLKLGNYSRSCLIWICTNNVTTIQLDNK